MKIGIRKPRLKKSIKARTTGVLKRKVKKSVNPLYGKKGVGMINDPKKAIYNKVYNKTTVDVRNIVSSKSNRNTGSKNKVKSSNLSINSNRNDSNDYTNRNYILLKNESGNIKKCKEGISWFSFLFLYLVPLCRLDMKNTFIQFFVFTVLSLNGSLIGLFLFLVAYLYFGITYNKTYIKDLIDKGYYVIDSEQYIDTLSNKKEDFNAPKSTLNDLPIYLDDNIDKCSLEEFSCYNDCYEEDDDNNYNYSLSISLSDCIKSNDFELDEESPEGYYNIIKNGRVVGVNYEDRNIFVEKFIFAEDRKVILQREPDNKYDINAIKVIGSCNYHGEFINGDMGYLSKKVAKQLKGMNSICATINYLNFPNEVVLNIHLNDEEFKIFNSYKLNYEEMNKFDNLSFYENQKGMEYEKDKNIDKAIEHYEKSIGYNFQGSHPYNRLAILYRKNKDYDNEIRVLRKAIEVYEIIERVAQNESQSIKLYKFKERLDKAILLKQKYENKSKA